jgi:hypothetical protein
MKWILVCLILFLSQLCPAKLRADLNGDCRVDFADLHILMSEWMQEEFCEMALPAQIRVNGITEPEALNGIYQLIDGVYLLGGNVRYYVSFNDESWVIGDGVLAPNAFVGDDGDANNLPTSWTEQPGYSGTVIVTEYTDTGGIMLDLYDELWSW